MTRHHDVRIWHAAVALDKPLDALQQFRLHAQCERRRLVGISLRQEGNGSCSILVPPDLLQVSARLHLHLPNCTSLKRSRVQFDVHRALCRQSHYAAGVDREARFKFAGRLRVHALLVGAQHDHLGSDIGDAPAVSRFIDLDFFALRISTLSASAETHRSQRQSELPPALYLFGLVA